MTTSFLPIFPVQAPAGVAVHGAAPVYTMLDDLFGAGVVSGFGVVQNPLGANLSVTVQAGHAYVAMTSGGKRLAILNANSNSGAPGVLNADDWLATFTAPDASNPRIDRVFLVARDSNVDGGSGAYDFKLKVVPGVPSAGANLTNLTGAASATLANAILLANVVVRAAATTILTTDIGSVSSAAKVGSGGASLSTPPAPKSVRGGVNGGSGNPNKGSGFTSVRSSTGFYTVTFDTPFSAPPVVSVDPVSITSTVFYVANQYNVLAGSFQVITFSGNPNAYSGGGGISLADVSFGFTASDPS